MPIPGRMNDRLTITPASGVADEWGNPTPGVPFKVWAELGDVKRAETASGPNIATGATLQAAMYYKPVVETTATVTVGGVTYNIVGMASNRQRDERIIYLAVKS